MSLIDKLTNRNNKLISMDPWTQWNWGKDFDQFFTNTLQGMGYTPKDFETKMMKWSPSVDISESKEAFNVKAELPGLTEEDIDITFQDNTLYLTGEKKFENKDDNESYHRIESSYGQFTRVIPFTVNVDEDKIKAEFKNGILNITLGKSKETLEKTRKIRINK